MNKDPMDPKGLIRESFRIDGITAPECRSIFLDWALSVPVGADTQSLVRALMARYADQPADHPMQTVLRGALETAQPERRGGRAGRMQG